MEGIVTHEGCVVSKSLFPADFIIDEPKLDLEMMLHHSRQWRLEHSIMGQGAFSGAIHAVHTPHIQIARSSYSHAFMTQGDFPNGAVLLFFVKNNGHAVFQNRLIDKHEIILSTKGDEIDFLVNSADEIYTIAIEEDLFEKSFLKFFKIASSNILKNKRLLMKPNMAPSLSDTIDIWISYLKNDFSFLLKKPDYRLIEERILEQIYACVDIDPLAQVHKKFHIKTVRDLLHSKLEEPASIATLANELGISERQLHNVFKSEYGMTPKKYLQNLRLNAIKKELLHADRNKTKIIDVALKYHFFHMGHFAAEYKKMFAETPSFTLSR